MSHFSKETTHLRRPNHTLETTFLQLCKPNHTWTLIQNKMTSLLWAQAPPTAYDGSGFLIGSTPQHRVDQAKGINGVAT